MNNKICFLAQFAPPITGLSKAVETLYFSKKLANRKLYKINTAKNYLFPWNLIRMIGLHADLYYLTLSQSRAGNLRDLIFLMFITLSHNRVIVHLHGGNYRQLVDSKLPVWQKKLNYMLLGRVSSGIVLGPSLTFNFQGMIPDSKIYVVKNCVDDKYVLSDEEFIQKSNVQNLKPIKHIVFLSNFIREKGYRYVLEMAKMAKIDSCSKTHFHFDFAGAFFSKKESDYFFNYIRDNGLDNIVTYHGVVEGERKKKLLANADAFVLLTSYPKEGQPISILEAQANGAVVIASDFSGIPDIIQDTRTGFLLNLDEGAIAHRAYRILCDVNYSEIGRYARATVLKNHSEAKYITDMESVFTKNLD